MSDERDAVSELMSSAVYRHAGPERRIDLIAAHVIAAQVEALREAAESPMPLVVDRKARGDMRVWLFNRADALAPTGDQ
jgi:hypothetical protein